MVVKHDDWQLGNLPMQGRGKAGEKLWAGSGQGRGKKQGWRR